MGDMVGQGLAALKNLEFQEWPVRALPSLAAVTPCGLFNLQARPVI
jgi:hypothetical protein